MVMLPLLVALVVGLGGVAAFPYFQPPTQPSTVASPTHNETKVPTTSPAEMTSTGEEMAPLRDELTETVPIPAPPPEPTSEELAVSNPTAVPTIVTPVAKTPLEHTEAETAPAQESPQPTYVENVDRGVSALTECTDQLFTVSPVDLDQVYDITPLGNLNPPEHTLPTEHMYLHLTSQGIPLRAPADIRITGISSTSNHETNEQDYSLEFSLCKDVHGYFIHLKKIEPELQEYLLDCRGNVYGGGKYEHCWTNISHDVTAGEVLGTVGNEMQTNFDFGVYDYRTTLDYANPPRYSGRSLHITCPIELFDDATKSEFYSKISRTADPKCGEVMQDVKDTLQGNWFFEDVKIGQPSEWTQHLSFAHDNSDPSKAVISIGGVFTDASRWIFTPKDSGFVDREFRNVTSDGNIYCYDQGQPGRILLQLTSETELKIEQQEGSCAGSFAFNNPVVYNR